MQDERIWVYIGIRAQQENEEATSSTPSSRGEIAGHNQALPKIRDRRVLHHRWRISPKRLIKQLCTHGDTERRFGGASPK